MHLEILLPLLDKIHGATFATLDAETQTKGLTKIVKGQRVILYRTKGESGYEAKVKRHLAEAGLDPDRFRVGPLPWGERVDDLPLIVNNGNYYLQCIPLNRPKPDYFLPGGVLVPDPSPYGVRERRKNPDLPEDKQVIVSCYNIENITRIALMGEEVFDANIADKPKRAILKLSFNGKE